MQYSRKGGLYPSFSNFTPIVPGSHEHIQGDMLAENIGGKRRETYQPLLTLSSCLRQPTIKRWIVETPKVFIVTTRIVQPAHRI
jgi:hypothetical protein